jgi:DNA-binding MarR family transcriptional regulator
MTERTRHSDLVRALDGLIVKFDQEGRQNRDGTVKRAGLLTGLDMTFSTLLILERMKDHSTTRMIELAQSAGVTCATVTRQIQALESKGLVFRTQDEQDGRVNIVMLTEKGHTVAEVVGQARQETLQQALDEWNEDDLQQLRTLFERLQGDIRRFWIGRPQVAVNAPTGAEGLPGPNDWCDETAGAEEVRDREAEVGV